MTGSTEALFAGPARPYFLAGGGDDVVLTGALDAEGDLGNGPIASWEARAGTGAAFVAEPGGGISGGRGNDRLIGGPGDDWLLGALGDDSSRATPGGTSSSAAWGTTGSTRAMAKSTLSAAAPASAGDRRSGGIGSTNACGTQAGLLGYGCISKD